jgi:hypothetical protein
MEGSRGYVEQGVSGTQKPSFFGLDVELNSFRLKLENNIPSLEYTLVNTRVSLSN